LTAYKPFGDLASETFPGKPTESAAEAAVVRMSERTPIAVEQIRLRVIIVYAQFADIIYQSTKSKAKIPVPKHLVLQWLAVLNFSNKT